MIKEIKPVDTQKILASAAAEAQKWETPLGSKKKGEAQKAFEALANGRIEIGNPQAHMYRLDEADFAKHGVALSPEIAKNMASKSGYDFYVLRVPVMVFPARGSEYRLLEGELKFSAVKGTKHPAIHAIFPEPFWNPVLSWGGSMDLALDGNLNFGVGVPEIKAGALDTQLAARVGATNKLAGFIKIISFEHTLGRMEIESRFSAQRAMWRLDSKQVIRSQKHAQFVVLLQVPKDTKQIVLEAAAQAEVEFEWLIAQINHVFSRLSKTLQGRLEKRDGLPLQDFKTWTLNLPT